MPKRIGFVQCVGSRCQLERRPVLLEHLLHEHHQGDAADRTSTTRTRSSTVFYTDIRAFGKGFEDLYRRSREAGARYVRGLPGLVEEDPETGDLIVHVENTTTGEHGAPPARHAGAGGGPGTARARQTASAAIDQILTLSHTSDGFVMEAHPKLKPVDAPTRGVYFAGCVEVAEGHQGQRHPGRGRGGARGQPASAAARSRSRRSPRCSTPRHCNFCGALRQGLPLQRHHGGRQEGGQATPSSSRRPAPAAAPAPPSARPTRSRCATSPTSSSWRQVDAILADGAHGQDRGLRLQLVLLRRWRQRRAPPASSTRPRSG